MRIILDGKKVGKSYVAYYEHYTAYFKRRGLTKRTVLHELYHHIVSVRGLEMALTEEERKARIYSQILSERVE